MAPTAVAAVSVKYARNGEHQFASHLVKSDSKYAMENEEDDVFQVDLPPALPVEETL